VLAFAHISLFFSSYTFADSPRVCEKFSPIPIFHFGRNDVWSPIVNSLARARAHSLLLRVQVNYSGGVKFCARLIFYQRRRLKQDLWSRWSVPQIVIVEKINANRRPDRAVKIRTKNVISTQQN
jgi:hypothetical protein